MATREEAEAMFWAAVRDWDPSSIEIAQDLCIDHGLTLHELGYRASTDPRLGTMFPGVNFEGAFVIDDGNGAGFTAVLLEDEDGYGHHAQGVEVWFAFTGSRYGAGGRFHQWSWSWIIGRNIDKPTGLALAKAGALEAWAAIGAMKQEVEAAKHRGEGPYVYEVKEILFSNKNAERTPPEINPARGLEPNPPWLTTAISDVYDVIQKKVPPEWLPLLSKAHGRGGKIIAEMKEYGCGAYGCVIPTLSHDVVLKATTDVTETEFAAKFSRELVVPIVVEYHMVVALSATHNGQRVSLLWREAADDVGKIKKTKNGRAAVKVITSQHHAAARVLLAIRDGVANMKVLDNLFAAWIGELDKMALVPELAYVATGMKRVWLEQKIFIADVHDGNLGKCHRGGKLQWVITDPGNVVVMR